MTKQKVIIWGHPLHSHTHSYIHGGFKKGFEHMGCEVHWFNNEEYPDPTDFDYGNSLIITEGFDDTNLPIVDSSTYFVHCCKDPYKYLDKGVRLVDIRYNVKELNDVNYSYVFSEENPIKIGACEYYQKTASTDGLNSQWVRDRREYEAIYLSWATDLLPHEFNYDDMKIPRQRKSYYVGSISSSNIEQIQPFARACASVGVEFIHNDPWRNPLSWEENKKLVQESYIAPDIRGVGLGDDNPDTGCNHLKTGYIPCRVFKNISYGQVGMTNSKIVSDLFDGDIVYNSNTYNLFFDTEANITNYDLIEHQMNVVRDHHTYLNRCGSILKVYNNEV
jgi:hypothetical protein